MSLKKFHLFFITLSAALALGLGIWGFKRDELILGAIGLVLLILLIPYSRWFLKKMNRLACIVCLGDPNSLLTHGAKMGVIFLVLVVGAVLAAIALTAFSWKRRAKHFCLKS